MTYDSSNRVTDFGGWSAHWSRRDVYDQSLSTAIGAAAMLLCVAIYFELNRHVWFFDLLGPSILTFSILFFEPTSVSVSLAANCPG